MFSCVNKFFFSIFCLFRLLKSPVKLKKKKEKVLPKESGAAPLEGRTHDGRTDGWTKAASAQYHFNSMLWSSIFGRTFPRVVGGG